MLENVNLVNYIEVILNKKIDDISDEDFQQIKNISFSKINENNDQTYNIEELLKFNKLENITIYNSVISNDDIVVLSKFEHLTSINFEHCFFQVDLDLNSVATLKSLKFRNCYMKDYSILKDLLELKILEIVFPYREECIDVSLFKNLQNLNILVLEGCNIINESELVKIKGLEILYLIYTEIKDLSFINKLNSLKKIYLSSKYIKDLVIENSKLEIYDSGIDMLIGDDKV